MHNSFAVDVAQSIEQLSQDLFNLLSRRKTMKSKQCVKGLVQFLSDHISRIICFKDSE